MLFLAAKAQNPRNLAKLGNYANESRKTDLFLSLSRKHMTKRTQDFLAPRLFFFKEYSPLESPKLKKSLTEKSLLTEEIHRRSLNWKTEETY